MTRTLLAAPAACRATSQATLEDCTGGVTQAARIPKREQVIPERLPREPKLAPTTLQIQRQRTKLGWEEVLR